MEEIKFKREQFGTFHHDRQAAAEAEAIILVRAVRDIRPTIGGASPVDAYFLSTGNTIDLVANGNRTLTMQPPRLSLWLSALCPSGPDESDSLFRGLVGELSNRNASLVDVKAVVNSFGPLVAASKADLNHELDHNAVLISQMYGPTGISDLRAVAPVKAPIVLQSLITQENIWLKNTADAAAKRISELTKEKPHPEGERLELERLRQRQSAKRRKSRARRGTKAKGKAKKRR